MLPAIGLIVGIYAFIRYAEIIFRPDRHIALKVLVSLAALVTVVLMADLVMTSVAPSPSSLGF